MSPLEQSVERSVEQSVEQSVQRRARGLSQRRFRIGGALYVVDGALLLVANRRLQGHIEWTPPGGVIDRDESLLTGIAREVREETNLQVKSWNDLEYSVIVDAPDMGWHMTVESWSPRHVTGEIELNDPDGIVEDARYVPLGGVGAVLSDSPPWIHVPIGRWLDQGCQPVGSFSFVVRGADRATARVEQLWP